MGLAPGDRRLLSLPAFSTLLAVLRDDGYRVIGPIVRDGAITYGDLDRVEDLPAGWTDAQGPGTYRLARRGDDAWFGHGPGAEGLKPSLFVPLARLFRATREGTALRILPDREQVPRLAVIGARSCDLHGVEIQDRVFLRGPSVDPDYRARREDAFVVAVHCLVPGGTCFCASMGTGPRANLGFDLALGERLDGEHRFVVDVGTERGARLLERFETVPAPEEDLRGLEEDLARAAASMGRTFDDTDIRGLLLGNLEHPRWDDVASRCLACTNCTLVCPTCFCAAVGDGGDLAGTTAERVRRWDSCFTLGHSRLHGGSVRPTIRSRYRQWLVHKVATWIDQFGRSGCVGCGRCITWCPVGIDLTEEVAAIRATDGRGT